MAYIFNNRAVSHITQSISSGDTQIRVPWSDFPMFMRKNSFDYMLVVLRGPVEREIVKIDIAASEDDEVDKYLVVERGQGGTGSQDWPAGTLIFLSTTADHYGDLVQPDSIRQVDFNPNGVISPNFAGEKIYQYSGCEIRWWQSFNAIDPYWHLIAGEPCDGEFFENPTGFFVSNVWIPVPPVIPTWLPITKEKTNIGPQYWQVTNGNFVNTSYWWQAFGSHPLSMEFDVYRNGGPDLRVNWPISANNIRGFRLYTSDGLPMSKVEFYMGPGPPGWESCTKQFLNVASGADMLFELPTCDPGYTSDELYGFRVWVESTQRINHIEVADADQTDLWSDCGAQICFTPQVGSWGSGGGGTPPGWISTWWPGGPYYLLILGMYVNPGTIDNRTACPGYPSPPEKGRQLGFFEITEYNDIQFNHLDILHTYGPEGSFPWLNSTGYEKGTANGPPLFRMSEIGGISHGERIDWYSFNLNEWAHISSLHFRADVPFRITNIDFWDNGP